MDPTPPITAGIGDAFGEMAESVINFAAAVDFEYENGHYERRARNRFFGLYLVRIGHRDQRNRGWCRLHRRAGLRRCQGMRGERSTRFLRLAVRG